MPVADPQDELAELSAARQEARQDLAPGGRRIVFESEACVVVDKKGGWLAVPGRTGAADPRPVVGLVLAEVRGAQIFPVHRLDVEVSGLTLYAKTAEAHRVANGWFEGRQVHKTYEAWSEGQAPACRSEVQIWTSRLERGKKRAFEAPHGKPAETKAQWLASFTPKDGHELQEWRLEPLTGRPHQLRFELAKRGCPIAGDRLYGATRAWTAFEGIALRAVALDFAGCANTQMLGLPEELRVAGMRKMLGG